MKYGELIIRNWMEEKGRTVRVRYRNIWFSQDGKYAVAVMAHGDVFIAVQIENRSDNQIIAFYVDMYEEMAVEVDLRTYSVDWFNIDYGFAYLRCFEMESGFSGTRCRFYFDVELYKQRYYERNGVPYSGNKSFKVTKTKWNNKWRHVTI